MKQFGLAKLLVLFLLCGAIWYVADTDRSLFGLLPDKTEPALYVDSNGRLEFDISYNGKDRLFSTGIFGEELSGALIVNEHGHGVGLKDSRKLDYQAVRQELYVFGTYLIIAQDDRDVAGMVAFKYDFGKALSNTDLEDGARNCVTRYWKRMWANGCVTVQENGDLYTVTDPYLKIDWPETRNGFMRKADFAPLVTELCESGQYVVIDGECPIGDSAFDVSLRPTYPDARFSMIRLTLQADGKRVLGLAANIRPSERDISKLTITRKDKSGDWKIFSEAEKLKLLQTVE